MAGRTSECIFTVSGADIGASSQLRYVVQALSYTSVSDNVAPANCIAPSGR